MAISSGLLERYRLKNTLLTYALPYAIDKLFILIAIGVCFIFILINFRTGGLNANYRKLIMVREGYFLLLFFVL